MKKNVRNLLVLRMALLILLSACAFCVHSQVTVGEDKKPEDFSVLEVSANGTKGGLRLPQLSTKERNDWGDYFLGKTTTNPVHPSGSSNVTADELINAPGLAIFNMDTKCYEYWDSTRWVSLCEGNSLMTISPDPCQNVDAEIPDCDDEFKVTDPDCENGPFTIMIVAGQDYAELPDVNETDGIFLIAFRENNSIYRRSVVVRVTSSCTGLYKDFLFLQKGHPCEATYGMAPEITSVPRGKNIDFCVGGAVYLLIDETKITAPGALEHVIWTRNNIEIARGVNNIVVTQEGKYDVWMGYIGCNQRTGNAVTVTRDGTGAPQPVSIVVNGNNGMVCGGPSGTTELVALNPNGSGTVLWFKNGVQTAPVSSTPLPAGGGVRVIVGIGNWFAVVLDGTCYSLPSETVSVIENPISGGSLTKPVIDKGGSFCAGSSILLSVSGSTYDPSYIYTWYENNTQIGMGRSVMYTVSSDAANVVIRCRATQPGSCAVEALEVEAITTGTIPAQPAITGNTVLCAGKATLNVIPQSSVGAGATYAWYKNNELIGTTQQITVTSGGDYYATVTDGCTSPMAHVNIPATSSANPVVTLITSSTTPGAANIGDNVTYNASITFGPALNYIWTITNATLVLGGQPGDTYAVVEYGVLGTASVKVEASNACGTATATRDLTVSDICADPDPTTISPSVSVNVSAITGLAFTLGPVSVNYVSGSPATSYQWYRNTAPSLVGGTPVGTSNTLAVTESIAGTYYYYCAMTNAGCVSSTVNTPFYAVSVVKIPQDDGKGNFSGKTVFDIAYSDFGGDCGTETNRNKFQRTDFSLTNEQDPPAGTSTPVYTGRQVYTFTPSGNVSNVRFIYLDASEQAIDSMKPKADYSGNISSGSLCKAVVFYKASLNTFLQGKNRANALKPELYVIYNDALNGAGTDHSIKMTVSLQDCSACGAVTNTGGWLNFMCHNLGADESLNPFTTNNDRLYGDLYQWGRPKDGHQLRSSGLRNAQAITNPPGHGDFIIATVAPHDWLSGGGSNDRWGDGGSGSDMPKTSNDPCPPGWKVPSQAQWVSIYGGSRTNPNTWTWSTGYKVGPTLYLPAAGWRRNDDGMFRNVGGYGMYWSSTTNGTNAVRLGMSSSTVNTGAVSNRGDGHSVRCISEY